MTRLLDRLQPANTTQRGIQTWSQRVCEQIEAAFADLTSQVAAIAAAQAAAAAAAAAAATAQSAANTAQTTANTANTTATTANTTANAVNKTDKISGSAVVPANVLTATNAGVITIASHTRVYGDGSQLSVAGGTITGRTNGSTYGVYYTDTSLADTTPTYTSTLTASNALNNFVTGRHYVGLITIPAAAAADTTGGTSPPGTGGDDRDKFSSL